MGRTGFSTPADFRKKQSNLLQKVADIDNFVDKTKESLLQQNDRSNWLVVNQQLDQECTECEAELLASAHTCQTLISLQSSRDGSGCQEGCFDEQLPEFEGLVPGCVSASLLISQLLQQAKQHQVRIQQVTVSELLSQIGTLRQNLEHARSTMAQLAERLWVESRAAAAAGRSSLHSHSAHKTCELAGTTRQLCSQHPLADAALKDHLIEVASQMEANFQQQKKRRLVAYATFLQPAYLYTAGSTPSCKTAPPGQQDLPLLHAERQSAYANPAEAVEASTKPAERHAAPVEAAVLEGGIQRDDGENTAEVPSKVQSSEDLVGSKSSDLWGGELDCSGGLEWEESGWGDEDAGGAAPSTSPAIITLPAPLSCPVYVGGVQWSIEEQAAFARIQRDCQGEGGGGGLSSVPPPSKEQVLGKMRARLPWKTPQQLGEFWRWFKEAGRLRNDVIQLEKGWDTDVACWAATAKAALEESSLETLRQAEAAMARVEWEVSSSRRAQCLLDLQEQRAVAREEHFQQWAGELQHQEARHEARRTQQEHYRTHVAQLLAQYRQAREAEYKAAQLRAAEEAACRQQEDAQTAIANKHRVEYRRRQDEEKAAKKVQADRARENWEERQAAALQKLRAQVAPIVGRDPQRAKAHTAASRAAPPRRQSAGAAFREMFGYTTEDVLKDQRFKVYEALRGLNLHSYEYAREVVTRARPARPTRPENLTSLQIQLGLG